MTAATRVPSKNMWNSGAIEDDIDPDEFDSELQHGCRRVLVRRVILEHDHGAT